MQRYWRMVEAAAAFIRGGAAKEPAVGVLTGTGLGASAKSLSVEKTVSYRDIPNFPVSTAVGHTGRLLTGKMAGRQVMVCQGRFHLYEGYTPLEVVFPIRVMQLLGVKHLIVTNAAGGLNPDFKAGDVMLIRDHINLTGANPLVGTNNGQWGARFPDMTRAYDPSLARIVEKCSREVAFGLRKGVYAGLLGPSLETPAEIRFLKTIGADAVGLSTVQEVIAAVHAGMKIVGLSVITNLNDPDNPLATDVEAVIDVANRAAPVVDKIVHRLVEHI